MSYAPIYSKLTDLDTRLSILELSAKSAPVSVSVPVPVPVPDYANTVFAPVETLAPVAPASAPDSSAEVSGLREEINNLLKECAVNTSAINLMSQELAPLSALAVVATLATKEELTALATKGEEYALATKEELATLATKDELTALATKEELATLATKDELTALATKEELADVNTKFVNILAVLSQITIKITEATDRITALESSSSA
jgi:ribosomal protein L10